MIVSPITPHSKRIYSHRAGWGRLWSTRLNVPMAFDEDYSRADTIYLDHGMEFNPDSKGLNYFLKSKESYDKLAQRLELLQNFSGRVYSLDIDCPLYGTRAHSRLCDSASDRFKRLDFDRIDAVCRSAQTIKHSTLPSDTLVLGDSHSISAWVPGAAIARNDGKTLHGALNMGFSHWLDQFDGIKNLRTYFGNIDVRFHLARQPDPLKAALKLAKDYVSELCYVRHKYGLKNVEVVLTLPIENESRVLPKTGWYKGQPFYGNWNLRDRIHKAFNYQLQVECLDNGINVVKWPDTYTNEMGELDFAVMEKPRSVHISPEFYLWRDADETRNEEFDFVEAA